MDPAPEDAHAHDGGAFCPERVVLQVAHLAGIDHGLSLLFFDGRLGCFLPFFEGVHDVIDDGAGEEFHFAVFVVELLGNIACVGFGGKTQDDTLKRVSG